MYTGSYYEPITRWVLIGSCRQVVSRQDVLLGLPSAHLRTLFGLQPQFHGQYRIEISAIMAGVPGQQRILIVATGSRGDVQPYIGLAVGLRNAGFWVRLATATNFVSPIEDLGLEAVDARVQ